MRAYDNTITKSRTDRTSNKTRLAIVSIARKAGKTLSQYVVSLASAIFSDRPIMRIGIGFSELFSSNIETVWQYAPNVILRRKVACRGIVAESNSEYTHGLVAAASVHDAALQSATISRQRGFSEDECEQPEQRRGTSSITDMASLETEEDLVSV
jgi:hypothetical protein